MTDLHTAAAILQINSFWDKKSFFLKNISLKLKGIITLIQNQHYDQFSNCNGIIHTNDIFFVPRHLVLHSTNYQVFSGRAYQSFSVT